MITKTIFTILILLVINGELHSSDLGEIANQLIGKYIIIINNKETDQGYVITKDKMIAVPLDEIINNKIKERAGGKFKLLKSIKNEIFIIATPSSGDNVYLEALRVEKIDDGWRLYGGDGKEGDPGVSSITLRNLHFGK